MNEFQNRVVRPFLSSSFKDLEKEREALAKHSFPKLSQFCYQRDVFFYPVDLRFFFFFFFFFQKKNLERTFSFPFFKMGNHCSGIW